MSSKCDERETRPVGPRRSIGLRYPDDDVWKNPDLFWPDDRSWFAATDVDLWSLYVGGITAFTIELSRRVSTPWEFADRAQPLPIEN